VNRFARARATFWLLFTLLGASHPVHAGDDQRGRTVPWLPTYKQECAACHLAFPPGMLPADSWRRLLNDLPRHFGTDASLDAKTVDELAAWLSANAATYKRVREAPPGDRITRSAWFLRKHDEVPAGAWKRPAVKSPANCSACHTQAAEGDFNEHAVRIPR
jgi:mono/diheme cytochrome c family protein